MQALILQRAVQRLEAAGIAPLDDVRAMAEAHSQSRDPATRVLTRAALLAEREGLMQALERWRGRLPWLALAAALLVGLLSYGLLGAVIGHARELNAMAALTALLGPHLLSLLLWLMALVAGRRSAGGGGLMGRAAWLVAKLPGPRAAEDRLVLAATFDVLDSRPRLAVWALGAANHAVWSLALLLTLAGLLFAFSFLAYRLSWESTILGADFFAGFARASGWLPSLLGFATPDLSGDDNRGWALWLLGCTLVYGLGLRLVFLLVSLLRTRQLLRGLTLDDTDPAVRRLLARFAALDASEVLDRERQAPSTAAVGLERPSRSGSSSTAALGYELPEALPWPDAIGAALQARIAGSAAEKREQLARLQAAAPRRLLLLCHGPSSPDRGTERFLRAALDEAGAGALLLLGDGGSTRWRDWAAATALPLHAVFDDASAAGAWLDGTGQRK